MKRIKYKNGEKYKEAYSKEELIFTKYEKFIHEKAPILKYILNDILKINRSGSGFFVSLPTT